MEENYNYRTNLLFLGNQFKEKGKLQLSVISKITRWCNFANSRIISIEDNRLKQSVSLNDV